MNNPNIRKNRRILFLFFLTTTMSFFTFSQLMWNTNNFLPRSKSHTEFKPLNRLKTANYSPDFSKSGEDINVTLHQSYVNNSFNTIVNTWYEPFICHKKKDDLADCFLQALWYINDKYKYILKY